MKKSKEERSLWGVVHSPILDPGLALPVPLQPHPTTNWCLTCITAKWALCDRRLREQNCFSNTAAHCTAVIMMKIIGDTEIKNYPSIEGSRLTKQFDLFKWLRR